MKRKVKTVTLSDGTTLTGRQIMDRKKCCCAYAHKCMLAYVDGTLKESELTSVEMKRLVDNSIIKTVTLKNGDVLTVAEISKIKGCGNATARVFIDRYEASTITEEKLLSRVKPRTEWGDLKTTDRSENLKKFPPLTYCDRKYGM